jgi:uncharacterized membrane protein
MSSSPPAAPASGEYSPIDTMQAAFAHLSANPMGHVVVVGVYFFLVYLIVCAGFGAGFATLLAVGPDSHGPGFILAIYGIGALIGLVSAPLGACFWDGYEAATLREIDGQEPVTLGAVGRLALANLAAVLGLLVVNCALSAVGLLCCYVGVFFAMIPFRFAFLVAVDRGVGVGEALAVAWSTFRARMKDHFAGFLTAVVVYLVCSAIPIIGPMAAVPLLVTFEVFTYRALYRESAPG